MSFQSFSYFGFLILAWVAARLLRAPRQRQALLLLASYAFYLTWGLSFAAVLLASSVFNFFWGRILRRRASSALLWVGLLVNIGGLASFKYADSLARLLGSSGIAEGFHLLVPVGISF